MRLLLDTHIYLWALTNDDKLSSNARTLISEASEVYVSAASIWEAAIKIRIGKLEANLDQLANAVEKMGYFHLPITAQHAAYINNLPNLHKDPFDHMIIAQAICEPLKLLTVDSKLKDYSDLVLLV